MARGDEAFTEFARASWGRLLHAAYLLTGDRHRAEDAAQTALVRTYAAWSRVRHREAYAYARQVLVNHVTDGWRRPLREHATDAVPDGAADDDLADQVTRRRWVVDALAALTGRERAVVVLRHFFDLSVAEVAEELDTSIGNVKSTNARALAKLRVSTQAQAVPTGGARHGGRAG